MVNISLFVNTLILVLYVLVLEVKIFGQSNLTVSEGDPASFTCSVQCVAPGIACVGVSANWTRHGDTGDSDVELLPDGAMISMKHTNITLSFPTTTAGDTGAYVCTGVTQNFSSSDMAYLTVKGNNCISNIYACL